jgi:hypothetical protein
VNGALRLNFRPFGGLPSPASIVHVLACSRGRHTKAGLPRVRSQGRNETWQFIAHCLPELGVLRYQSLTGPGAPRFFRQYPSLVALSRRYAQMNSKLQTIDGNALAETSRELQDVIGAAIQRLGIWIDPLIYRSRPHLVPFAVRDAQSRSKANRAGVETWGAPDSRGYFRDDNTLVKNWVKSLDVVSREPAYNGRRIGNGFVACHVWRGALPDGRPLHAAPLLNSFVPNLVWLPSDLARLSDRVGSYTQRLLQVLARSIYADCEFTGRLAEYVAESWQQLPSPVDAPALALDPASLSFFSHDVVALERQHESLRRVARGILMVRDGCSPEKVYSRRYGPGLRELPAETLDELLAFLKPFIDSGAKP